MPMFGLSIFLPIAIAWRALAPLRCCGSDATVVGAAFVETRAARPMLAAQVGNWRAILGLLQVAHDLYLFSSSESLFRLRENSTSAHRQFSGGLLYPCSGEST